MIKFYRDQNGDYIAHDPAIGKFVLLAKWGAARPAVVVDATSTDFNNSLVEVACEDVPELYYYPLDKKMSEEQLRHALAQFSGADEFFSHWLGGLTYTGGVKYLADKAGAHWLIDAVASYQRDPRITKDEMLVDFQLWELTVVDNKADLTLRRDKGETPVIVQHIEYTDFPLGKVKLYLENGVLMLPNER